MAEYFVVGSLVFWATIVTWIAILWALLETEHDVLGLLSVVGFGCLMHFGFHVDILHLIMSMWYWTPLYFVVGALWAVWRWYLFATEQANKFVEMKMDWLQSQRVTGDTVPPELKEKWAAHLDNYENRELARPPLVRTHKSRIMGWIGYWPLSVLSWFFKDMLRGVVKAIYTYLHDWLQSIANAAFAKVRKDLPDDFK